MQKISLDVIPNEKEWFTQADIAQMIGRTAPLLSMLYKDGKFPTFDKRTGNKLYYKRSTVEEFLKNYEQYSSNPSRFKGSKNGKRSSKKAYKQMDILEEINNNG